MDQEFRRERYGLENGVKMTGVVGESTPAEPVTPEYTPEQPTSIDTPVLDSTSQTAPSVQQDTVQTPTLNERIQTAREKAKEATSKVTEGLYTIGTELGKAMPISCKTPETPSFFPTAIRSAATKTAAIVPARTARA